MKKFLASISILIVFLFYPVFSAANESGFGKVEVKSGEALVWYLGHCGYAIKTSNHFLLFDYIELEEAPTERGLAKGFIDPEELKDMNVTVFVTHSHLDHYDEIIFSWEKVIKNIQYVFGWKSKENPEYHYLEGPRAVLKLNEMEIYTVNSYHSFVPEVAYLVKVDGLVLFHGGDYQGRMGRNNPSNVKDDMKYLRTKVDSADLFFIGAWTGDPNIQAIEGLSPKVIFPMHDRKKEEKYKIFASDLKNLGIVHPVACPEKRGDHFIFKNGKIQ